MRNPTHPLTTVEEIEQAALEIFAERGFEDPTVEEIAAAAGISRRTFFRYFPTKADIPWGNFEALLANMDAWFASAPDDKPIFDVIAEGIAALQPGARRGARRAPRAHDPDHADPGPRRQRRARHADWSAVIARYAARRLDEPPEALAPQLVAHIALGASSAAYSEWLRDENERPRRPHQPRLRHGAVRARGPQAPRATPGGGHEVSTPALRRARLASGTGSASLLIPAAIR